MVLRYFRIVIILIIWESLVFNALGGELKKFRILILHSYHSGLTWTEGQDSGIREILKDRPDLEIFTEYLDSKRIPLNEIMKPFAAFLGQKYSPNYFDAVMVTDNSALTFMSFNYRVLFPNIPVVFCGINNYSPDMLEGFDGKITGVAQVFGPGKTVELILKLQPLVKDLVIVSGITPTARAIRAEVASALVVMKPKLNLVWLEAPETEQLLKSLSALSPNQAVLLCNFNRDAKGVYYSHEESGQMLSKASAVPVYAMEDHYMGTGVVGGHMDSSREQGKMAGQLCLEIIETGRIPSVVLEGTNLVMIDYQALVRFGLESFLPTTAVVFNKPFSVYQAYKKEIWGIGLTGIALLILVLFLGVNVILRKESEANLNVTLQSIGDAVIVTDCDGRIIRMNPVAESLTGWNARDAMDKKIDLVFHIIHSKTREKAENPVGKILSAGRIIGLANHTALISKQGTEYQISDSGAPIVSADGKITGVVLVFRDVTEEYRKTREICDQKELLETTFSSIQDGVSILNTDYTIRYANPVMEAWHVDKLPLTGKKCYEIFFDREKKCNLCSGVNCVTTGSACRQVVEIPYMSGPGLRSVELSNFPIKNATTGEVTGIVEFLRDITEQKQTEAQLRQAQKHEAIGTLAGGIAHDFNNILSGIFGFCQLAQIHIANQEKVKSHLSNIQKGAERAADLVRQILSFSRQTDQKLHLISIQPMVTEVSNLLRSSFPSTIEIQNQFNATSLIEADPTQIHQVIMNLGTNAYHAMKKTGGRLTIQGNNIEVIDSDSMPVPDMTPGTYLMLTVSDTGEGMSREVLQKAFDPYFTTRERGHGTGMGLALVCAIVERLRGYLTVDSTLGQGTEVKIYLPVSDKKRIHRLEKPTLPIKGGTEQVMFVDDEVDICQSTRELLANYGYRVAIFMDGPEALSAFQAAPESYDLVITDMTMPRMKGTELAEKILAIRPNMPVLLCSGYIDDASEKMALNLGIQKCLRKPISNRSLLMLLRKIFDGKKG